MTDNAILLQTLARIEGKVDSLVHLEARVAVLESTSEWLTEVHEKCPVHDLDRDFRRITWLTAVIGVPVLLGVLNWGWTAIISLMEKVK